MEKIKEYITKNKKIVIPVVIIIILLLIGGIYFAVQSNSDHSDSKIESTKQEANKSKGKETTKDLDTYVKGIKDWTIEVGAKNINFLKDFTFDKKVIKDVTVDASKVDLTKEGKYDLTYNIIPIDTTIDKKTVIKTVEVISKEKAQKEADKGNQVITSGDEIKKNLKITMPTQRKKLLLIRTIPILPTHRTLMAIAIITITMEVLSRIRITILETPALIIVNLSNRLSLLIQKLLFISITSTFSYQRKAISNMAKKHMRNKFQNMLKFIGTNAMSAMNILMMK